MSCAAITADALWSASHGAGRRLSRGEAIHGNDRGLWNREAGTRIAQEYMARKPQGERCALMLLDMDNFTRINQEEGIAFANAVLQEVADVLRAETEPAAVCIAVPPSSVLNGLYPFPVSSRGILPELSRLFLRGHWDEWLQEVEHRGLFGGMITKCS